MIRPLLLLLACLIGISCFSQKSSAPTSSFTIMGEVKAGSAVQSGDLAKWHPRDIGDIVITNHLGEKKSEAKGLKGVLLKDVLESVEIQAESPKVLSAYYFVCKANDGYTVIYSWNELFNSATGQTTYLVTEMDGKSIAEMNDAILMVSSADLKTGRRYLKSLTSIEVKRDR